jgi:hypothetical protein
LIVSSDYNHETNNGSLIPAIEKIDANLREMKDEMRTTQEKTEARMDANNEKF